MNNDDKKQFKELILVTGETYEQLFSASKTKIWWDIFKPYPIDVVASAFYSHMSCADSGMFSPKPANLMKFIKLAENKILPTPKEPGISCCDNTKKLVAKYGNNLPGANRVLTIYRG